MTFSSRDSRGPAVPPVVAPVVRPAARLGTLVVGQALAVAALVAAGASAPFAGVPWVHGFGHWFHTAAPVDAVAVVVYRVALVVAAWLLAGTLLHLAAALVRVPALVRATAWAAMPSARRAVAAVVVTAGVLAPTAAAHATDSAEGAPSGVRDGRAVVTATAPPAPAAVPPAVTSWAPTTLTVPPATAAAATPAASVRVGPLPAVVVVQPGDSLWSIATEVVAAEQGRTVGQVTDADIATRWALIRELNATRLPSGDASLVFPGDEVIVRE